MNNKDKANMQSLHSASLYEKNKHFLPGGRQRSNLPANHPPSNLLLLHINHEDFATPTPHPINLFSPLIAVASVIFPAGARRKSSYKFKFVSIKFECLEWNDFGSTRNSRPRILGVSTSAKIGSSIKGNVQRTTGMPSNKFACPKKRLATPWFTAKITLLWIVQGFPILISLR